MVLTLENAGALIPGVRMKEDNVATIRVKVLRGFFDGKTSLKPGDIVTINSSLARQAKEANKVVFLPEEPSKIIKPAIKPEEVLKTEPRETESAEQNVDEVSKAEPKKSKK